MRAVATLPRWVAVLVLLLSGLFVVRYMVVIDTGIDHATAIRTYTFWAVVTLPVACLADVLGRTIMNYRIVQLALARVQANSRR